MRIEITESKIKLIEEKVNSFIGTPPKPLNKFSSNILEQLTSINELNDTLQYHDALQAAISELIFSIIINTELDCRQNNGFYNKSHDLIKDIFGYDDIIMANRISDILAEPMIQYLNNLKPNVNKLSYDITKIIKS